MNKFNWMPILRTGTFTDKNKQTVTIDEAKLDAIVAATDLTKEPQFVVEHPSFDEIGFGTIEQLKRVGSYLFALPKTVEEKFKKVVNSGKLPGRSVTIDKKSSSLKNISFLPAEIEPAVSDLGAYAFAENKEQGAEGLSLRLLMPGVESHFADLDSSNFEFAQFEVSNYPFRIIRDMISGLRDFIIDKFDLDTADKILPKWQISEIGDAPKIFEKETNKIPSTSFSLNKNNGEEEMKLKDVDLSKLDPALKTAIEGLQTELETKTVELQAATTKLTTAETEKLHNEVLQFCEGEDVKLKIKPADKDKVVNFLMTQKTNGVIEFSAADKSKVSVNAFEFAKELIKNQPDVIELSEMATKKNAAEDNLTDYQKTAKTIADFVNR